MLDPVAPLANAWLDGGLSLRVGVPRFNGRLPTHCSEQETPIMVSAGAYWRPQLDEFAMSSRYGWSIDIKRPRLQA